MCREGMESVQHCVCTILTPKSFVLLPHCWCLASGRTFRLFRQAYLSEHLGTATLHAQAETTTQSNLSQMGRLCQLLQYFSSAASDSENASDDASVAADGGSLSAVDRCAAAMASAWTCDHRTGELEQAAS